MWLILLVILLILVLCLYKLNENYFLLALCKRIKTEDGSKLEDKICVLPGAVPLFGNSFDVLKFSPEKIFQHIRKMYQIAKGKSYVLYVALFPIYNITTAEDAAELFQSKVLKKSVLYSLTKSFLGDSLLNSDGPKWVSRRKLLTPTLHFNILISFNEVFKEESQKLLKKLQSLPTDEIDANEIITPFTLNNVIETALGVNLDDISGSAEYRQAIHDIESVIVQDRLNPWMLYDTVFRLFGRYKQYARDLKIAQDFSSKVIEKKRVEYRLRQASQKEQNEKDTDEHGNKKRYAMLDTLLAAESKGNIDHQGICDEVNTFMFAGYDTTSVCLVFTLQHLALYPDIQDKCRDELANIGEFSSLTVFDFNKLEYLECVLKESLRMFPPISFLARSCVGETRMNGLILPKNTEIFVHTYDIMRDPKHYPDPDVYKPERFLPENSKNRHPFAFVPFSAGSRNCIGQKFALLQMKTVMVALLLNFRILPVTKFEDLVFQYNIVLKTKDNIYVKLQKLNNN